MPKSTKRVSALKLNIPMSVLKTNFADYIRNTYNRASLTQKRWEDRNVADLNDVYLACEEAYFLGAVFRRAKGGRGKYENTPGVDKVLKKLADKLYDFFNGCGPFDFYGLCDDFKSDLNAERASVGYTPISFGQAQKMINITVKYLYCYDDSNKFRSRFALCHAPLDAIMKNKVYNELNVFGYPDIKVYRKKVKPCAWTSLEDVDVYEEYRKAIDFLAACVTRKLGKKVIFIKDEEEECGEVILPGVGVYRNDVIPLEIDFYLW